MKTWTTKLKTVTNPQEAALGSHPPGLGQGQDGARTGQQDFPSEQECLHICSPHYLTFLLDKLEVKY